MQPKGFTMEHQLLLQDIGLKNSFLHFYEYKGEGIEPGSPSNIPGYRSAKDAGASKGTTSPASRSLQLEVGVQADFFTGDFNSGIAKFYNKKVAAHGKMVHAKTGFHFARGASKDFLLRILLHFHKY